MNTVTIKDDFIKLGQVLKLAGEADSGIDAKMMILDGLVEHNGQVCTMRGKKVYVGDTFSVNGNTYQVTK